MLWTSAKNYVPLYGSQEQYDKASILDILDNEKVPFKIETDTGNIMVPQSKLADARITLAARGITAAMPEGLAGINDRINMGTSQFMESMQYQHALEGELARSIIHMEGVRNARVHLAVPRRTLFIGRTEEKAAASVMLELTPGHTLAPYQVEAIINLVAGSVPGLDATAIAVVDQRGTLLSADIGDNAVVGRDTDKKLAFIDRIERAIEQSANSMLVPILGQGNFRIRVSSDVDFSVVEETREVIDPDSVIKVESIRSDTMLDQLAMGIPGSLANRPPLPVAEGTEAENNQRTSERNETNRQFENGRAVTHTKYEVGRLRSMSLSVLVNDAVAADESGWTPQRLEQLGEMVKTATGFQLERGDAFNITSFRFVEPADIAEYSAINWWQRPEVLEYARYLIGALLGLALIIFGIRPLVQNLTASRSLSEADEPESEHEILGDGAFDSQDVQLSGKNAANLLVSDDAENDQVSPFDAIRLPQLGSEFAEQITHMQLLASKESDRVAAVIRHWIEKENVSESS
jgi:flagellar M-ring protein FliF